MLATCSRLLAVDGCESNPQSLGYESDTLPLHHSTHYTTYSARVYFFFINVTITVYCLKFTLLLLHYLQTNLVMSLFLVTGRIWTWCPDCWLGELLGSTHWPTRRVESPFRSMLKGLSKMNGHFMFSKLHCVSNEGATFIFTVALANVDNFWN